MAVSAPVVPLPLLLLLLLLLLVFIFEGASSDHLDFHRVTLPASVSTPDLNTALGVFDCDNDGIDEILVIDRFPPIHQTQEIVMYKVQAEDGGIEFNRVLIAEVTERDPIETFAIGDLDGDGYMDMVFTQSKVDEVVVYILHSSDCQSWSLFRIGSFPPNQEFQSRSMVLTDLNRDGKLDIWFWSKSVPYFINNLSGSFPTNDVEASLSFQASDNQLYPGQARLQGSAGFDFTGDAIVDIMAAEDVSTEPAENQSHFFYALSSDGSYANAVDVAVGPRGDDILPFSVAAVGDCNNDGLNDFILSSVYNLRPSEGLKLYVANGLETGFAPASDSILPFKFPINNEPTLILSVDFGDLDLDGNLDLLVRAAISGVPTSFGEYIVNQSFVPSHNIPILPYILYGSGDCEFAMSAMSESFIDPSDQATYLQEFSTHPIALSDFDSDGLLDIVDFPYVHLSNHREAGGLGGLTFSLEGGSSPLVPNPPIGGRALVWDRSVGPQRVVESNQGSRSITSTIFKRAPSSRLHFGVNETSFYDILVQLSSDTYAFFVKCRAFEFPRTLTTSAVDLSETPYRFEMATSSGVLKDCGDFLVERLKSIVVQVQDSPWEVFKQLEPYLLELENIPVQLNCPKGGKQTFAAAQPFQMSMVQYATCGDEEGLGSVSFTIPSQPHMTSAGGLPLLTGIPEFTGNLDWVDRDQVFSLAFNLTLTNSSAPVLFPVPAPSPTPSGNHCSGAGSCQYEGEVVEEVVVVESIVLVNGGTVFGENVTITRSEVTTGDSSIVVKESLTITDTTITTSLGSSIDVEGCLTLNSTKILLSLTAADLKRLREDPTTPFTFFYYNATSGCPPPSAEDLEFFLILGSNPDGSEATEAERQCIASSTAAPSQSSGSLGALFTFEDDCDASSAAPFPLWAIVLIASIGAVFLIFAILLVSVKSFRDTVFVFRSKERYSPEEMYD